jgi:hypothetical protein
VKLDVDGHEYSVLAGGTQTLGQYKPIILMELEPCLYNDEPALQVMGDLGYPLRDVKNVMLQRSKTLNGTDRSRRDGLFLSTPIWKNDTT